MTVKDTPRVLVTESGATYEVDGTRIRRVNEDAPKRGDGDWINMDLRLSSGSLVGQRVFLILESLADYGPDDIGTPREEASSRTYRRTTAVVSDSWYPEEGS